MGFLNQLLYASSLIVLHAYRGFSEISALGIHALKPFLSGPTDGLRTVVLRSGEGRKRPKAVGGEKSRSKVCDWGRM